MATDVQTPKIKLANGAEMPQVGLGMWKMDNATCADVIYRAIKDGYRLFDGACDYGNEKEGGEGVARAIKDGLVKRSELFIISKLWNSFHDPEQVEPIVRKQLADWDVDYFDLYYIHFPVSLKYVDPKVRYPPGWYFDDAGTKVEHGKASLQSTWEAMEALIPAGLAKNIGVSNYTGALLLDLFTYAKTKPAVVQVEHHPYLLQQSLLDLCKSHGIAVTGYSSFGPQSFRDCDMDLAQSIELLFDHAVITTIANRHRKTAAQVLLRWSTQRGIAVIPKSNTQDRLLENLDVTSFDLSEEEIKQISGLDRGFRFNNPLNYGIPVYNFA
ncbi:Aldo/keto reductase [Lophium mytilinum]|uniref:Aldo/keto reductase n=1 Tax=Lophium mytilinum TaxID=390894 RepID=A0A6A6QZR9_9PEZI|nr:Aldo/keto reductase [Lophium mytilinum]